MRCSAFSRAAGRAARSTSLRGHRGHRSPPARPRMRNRSSRRNEPSVEQTRGANGSGRLQTRSADRSGAARHQRLQPDHARPLRRKTLRQDRPLLPRQLPFESGGTPQNAGRTPIPTASSRSRRRTWTPRFQSTSACVDFSPRISRTSGPSTFSNPKLLDKLSSRSKSFKQWATPSNISRS